jgi:hypothetical protein
MSGWPSTLPLPETETVRGIWFWMAVTGTGTSVEVSVPVTVGVAVTAGLVAVLAAEGVLVAASVPTAPEVLVAANVLPVTGVLVLGVWVTDWLLAVLGSMAIMIISKAIITAQLVRERVVITYLSSVIEGPCAVKPDDPIHRYSGIYWPS